MYAKREFFHFIKVALGRLVYARSDTTLYRTRGVLAERSGFGRAQQGW